MDTLNFTSEMKKKSEENFENIKKSIQGLYEILNINFSDEDTYYKLNEYGLRKLVKKIKDCEVDLDIELDSLFIEK